MKEKKLIWLIMSCVIVLSLVLVSCGEEEEEEEVITPPGEEEEVKPPTGEEEEEVIPPTGGNWWDKWGEPEYGGTFTARYSMAPSNWDPYYNGAGELWYETLAWQNFWGVDHKIYEFKVRFTPLKYYTGRLAESWEVQDNYQTYIFYIRQGVHFQDIPPVNGRELTAYDIEYSFRRMCGLGSGFDKPSPYSSMYHLVESVTATDKWTVVFKTTEPSLYQFRQLLDNHFYGSILAREAIELWGDVNDWTRCIGTGPFMISDYVDSVSTTAIRNPNYWGYDEHFPENRLPYIDTIKMMIIPDSATARAAFRTGKIDWMGYVKWEHLESLQKTNPELQAERLVWGGAGINMHVDKKPYSDIRVRKAMQMSIDLETIAATHYGGYSSSTPPGYIGHPGYSTPYDEWPKELQEEYTYNPEGARQLLAEAGYPNGFKCTLAASSSQDLDLAQVLQFYFADVGIDMEINTMEATVFYSYSRAGKTEFTYGGGYMYVIPPVNAIQGYTPTHYSYAYKHVDDPIYNELYNKLSSSFSEEEQQKYCRDAELYLLSQHWVIIVAEDWTFTLFQPWIKNFNGEEYVNSSDQVWARCWIDSAIKKSMGY